MPEPVGLAQAPLQMAPPVFVDDGGQDRTAIRERHPGRLEANVEQVAVLRPVNEGSLDEHSRPVAWNVFAVDGARPHDVFVVVAQVAQTHGEEFGLRPAILGDDGVVHGEEGLRLLVEYPHGHGPVLEQDLVSAVLHGAGLGHARSPPRSLGDGATSTEAMRDARRPTSPASEAPKNRSPLLLCRRLNEAATRRL